VKLKKEVGLEEWKKRVNAIKYKEDSKHTLETMSKKNPRLRVYVVIS